MVERTITSQMEPEVISPEPSGVIILESKYPYWTKLKGLSQEIDVLQTHVMFGKIPIKDAAPRFRELIAQNPEWEVLFARFGDSPKHFARILVEVFRDRFIQYSDIYRLTRTINLGEVTLKPYRPNLSIRQDLPALPADSPSGVALLDIATDYEIVTKFSQFTQDPQATLLQLEQDLLAENNSLQRDIYKRTLIHFQQILNNRIPAFRLDRQPKPHQSEAILKGTHNRNGGKTSIGVFDEMRTGKTLIGQGRVEHLKAQKVLVVTPAGVKRTWQERILEYYIEPPKSIILENPRLDRQLAKTEHPDTKYAVVSYDLLVDRRGNGSMISPLVGEISAIGFDCLILDEFQYAKNHYHGTKRAEAILALSKVVSIRHLMLLSGTPIDNMRDIEMIAHLLAPEDYPTPESIWEETYGRPNPRIAHNVLLPKIIRRTAAEVLKLPPVIEKTEVVTLTPTQRALYDFILNEESIHQFTKLVNLQAAILQPRLTQGIKVEYDENKALRLIAGAYIKWQRLKRHHPELVFDSDFLVQNGYKQLYITAQFNLKGGISELVQKSSGEIIKSAWAGESVPVKFQKIAEIIREKITAGEKVIIYTSFFTNGITQHKEDLGAEQEHVRSLLAYLQKEFGEERIIKIDGQDSTQSSIILQNSQRSSQRELLRRKWQEDRSIDILLCNKASSLGIDLSINDPTVTGVTVIYEGKPLSLPQFKQSKARVLDEKQTSPVTFIYLEADNTIDEDKNYLLEAKEQLEGMFLDAIPPTEEEQKIFEDSLKDKDSFLSKILRSPRQNVTLIFSTMMRQSVEDNRQLLQTNFTPSLTYGEYLAKWYDEVYIEGYAYYTTEIVTKIIQGLEKNATSKLRIADFGSGPLILARNLKRPVYSIDLSREMIEVGKNKLKESGVRVDDEYYKVGSITELPQDLFTDESIDIGICSLALDCISPVEERVKALKEFYRVLTPGGRLILTIPEAEMSASEYYSFQKGFKQLGFVDDLSSSGFVKGTTRGKTVFNCWVFVLKKSSSEEAEINPDQFTLAFEKNQGTKTRRPERRLQELIKQRSERTNKVERFLIYHPERGKSSENWPQRAEIHELIDDSLTRQLLDLTEVELTLLGFRKEIISRNGKQEIRLTRI